MTAGLFHFGRDWTICVEIAGKRRLNKMSRSSVEVASELTIAYIDALGKCGDRPGLSNHKKITEFFLKVCKAVNDAYTGKLPENLD